MPNTLDIIDNTPAQGLGKRTYTGAEMQDIKPERKPSRHVPGTFYVAYTVTFADKTGNVHQGTFNLNEDDKFDAAHQHVSKLFTAGKPVTIDGVWRKSKPAMFTAPDTYYKITDIR